MRGFTFGRLILSVITASFIVGAYHTVRVAQDCAENFKHARLIDHFLRTAEVKQLMAFYEKTQAHKNF
jgi:hypothetical protein